MRRIGTLVTGGALLTAAVLGAGDVAAGAASANLARNGSFESGVAPWKAWHLSFAESPKDGTVKISQVTSKVPAPGGGKHAARVTLVSGKCNEASWACGIGIQQLGVARWTKVAQNNCYVASAYVRAANAATVGKEATVTVPEYNGRREHADYYGSSVPLSSSWQKVTLDVITVENLGDAVGVKVEVDGAKPGAAFDVDLATLSHSPC
jgi:hypothetical protein